MSKKWKAGLRGAAILTALVVPGGCLALLAVALVKRGVKYQSSRAA